MIKNLKERIESLESEMEQLSISHKIMMDQIRKSFKSDTKLLIGVWLIAILSLISIFLWFMVILEVL